MLSARNPQTPQTGKNAHFGRPTRLAAKPVQNDNFFHQIHRKPWAAYRSPDTISQETGLPPALMLRSDLKELTDNGLDWCDRHKVYGLVTVTQHSSHTFTVANRGPGWQKTPKQLARLFSLARNESISSKYWRMPTRGAAGKGLMGVVGSVASGNGRITIDACNQRVVLRPRIDSTTSIEEISAIDCPEGTSITIEVDRAYPTDAHALSWANMAIALAQNGGPPFTGRPSPHWFYFDPFSLLLSDVAPTMTLPQFAAHFDGCSSSAVRKKITGLFGPNRLCRDLNREEAAQLLELVHSATRPIQPQRLGPLGREAWPHYSDGYDCKSATFITGSRQSSATIPFLAECWVKARYGNGQNDPRIVALTINRTGAIIRSACHRTRGRDVVLNLSNCEIDLSLPRGIHIEFCLNITSPLIPIVSTGKAPDLHYFKLEIKKVIEAAVARASRHLRSQSNTAKNKDQDSNHAPKEAGPLRRILEDAALESGCSIKELIVLSKERDPYFLDTEKGHRNARWFAEMVQRFLGPEGTIHLRGLHYPISSSADVLLPDGKPYVNDNEKWEWLTEKASKAARWLGYVPFTRIVDERNAPPELYLPPYLKVEAKQHDGDQIEIPSLEEALPQLSSNHWPVVQAYRIILLGEKTSLKKVLLPIAEMVGGELLLPTGEASDTMIAELAARCSLDSRPSVVLYFSDFDPSGYQMPVSVARKLQALRDLLYPQLDIRCNDIFTEEVWRCPRLRSPMARLRRHRRPARPCEDSDNQKH
jgi:hypothetical protein